MHLTIRALTFSEAGGHPANEDAFAAHPHPADPGRWIVCLADGQGGRAGGARAADIAVRTAAAAAATCPPADLDDPSVWQAILAAADDAVTRAPVAGLTTLVGLCVRDDGSVVGASCGDTAAFAACGSGGTHELTARQSKNPPVGSGAADFVPFEAALRPPWRLLVMSDGVWKYAGWGRVKDAASETDADAGMANLRRATRLQSGGFPDDFTVVVLDRAA